MKEIRKYHIPNICMTFTLIIVFTSINNLINNNDPTGYHVFVLQFVALLVVTRAVIYLINKVDFKNEHLQDGIVYCLIYGIFLTMAYFLRWFGFRISNIIIFTIIYIVITAGLTIHNAKISKEDERWINSKLEQRNNVIQETKDEKHFTE